MGIVNMLTRGLNLYGLSAGVNMAPGEATDAINLIPRNDNSIAKHWGARRLTNTAISGTVLGIIGFIYNGKNIDISSGSVTTQRPGNFGSDDDDQFSRRIAFTHAGLILTTQAAYFWDHTTGQPSALSLPTGVAILDPVESRPYAPTMMVLQDNVYIVGWADSNLRYDPTDQALYIPGWESPPSLAGAGALSAGGDLIAGKTYKYRAAWVDLYTGEQSGLSDPIEFTTTASNKTVTFSATDFPLYDEDDRHYKQTTASAPTAGEEENQDVGLVLYRTEADGEQFHFLDLIFPDLTAATLTDNGLATDSSRPATVVAFEDPKPYYAATVYRNVMYGAHRGQGTRLFFNDFTTTKSHFERTQPLNARDAPLPAGGHFTAFAPIDDGLVVFSRKDGYLLQAFHNHQTGQVQQTFQPLNFGVGCVGPMAWTFVDGWLYWLSERGPYRWRQGIPAPQWIGKNIAPLFLDPQTGICKLNIARAERSQVLYDQDADVIRYLFPLGTADQTSALENNFQVYQWARTSELNGKGGEYLGWFLGQPNMSTGYYGHEFGNINTDNNRPENRNARAAAFVFGYPEEPGSSSSHIWQYEPTKTSWLPDGHIGRFVATGGSTTTATVEGGVVGTAINGLRVEVVHADGTIEITSVDGASTTVSSIAFNDTLDTAVAEDDVVYIGGFPCHWRSWLDHGGAPDMSKKSIHFWLGFVNTPGDTDMDVIMTAQDDMPSAPFSPVRSRSVKMNVNMQKVISSLVGRFFFWEFTNSRPYEPFAVTYIKTDLQVLERGRR